MFWVPLAVPPVWSICVGQLHFIMHYDVLSSVTGDYGMPLYPFTCLDVVSSLHCCGSRDASSDWVWSVVVVVPPCTGVSSSPGHLSVRSRWRGVVVVLHCCRRARWTRICTVAPAQGAPRPCTGAFRAGAGRRAGSGVVLAWASSGVTRDRVGSGVTHSARPATICPVTRDQSLYHMPGCAWQRNSPCQLTWADGPGYFQAKK